MIASLDTVTLAFMGMGIGIALAVLMLFNWHIQKKQPGVAWWAAAFVLAAVGIILTALRATAPLWLCILLANTCLQALWLLFWIGVKRFAGSSGNGVLFSVIALALNFCFMFYFVYVQPSLSARIILFCSINALFTSLCAKELLLHYRRHPEAKASLVAGWVCVFHVVFSLTRILLTARSEPLHNLLTAGGIHTLAFIEGGLILLVLGLLLIMMSSQRLQGNWNLISKRLRSSLPQTFLAVPATAAISCWRRLRKSNAQDATSARCLSSCWTLITSKTSMTVMDMSMAMPSSRH